MKELKEFLKTKSFVINSSVLKNICNLDISLKEFILILYFINIDNHLDLEKIKKYIDLGDEEVLNIYTSLINKGLIEKKKKKNGTTIEEEVSLDLFYDKLILNKKEEKKETDIFEVFESEFGRTLSPIEYETINTWLDSNIDEETIKSALKEAVLNGVTNLKYINSILYEWTKKGIKNKSLEETKDFKDLFDYDWLKDE